MADGNTKPIEDVEIGDLVLATDPETGEQGPRRVTDLIVGEGLKELVEVEIEGETITATAGHPFWVDDEGRWVDAQELEAGDRLLLADGTTVAVDSVRERTEVRRVHNLTVDGIHTYYVEVGDSPVLVHNTGCGFDDLGGTAAHYERADLIDEIMAHNAGRVGRPTASQVDEALSTTGTRIRDGIPGRDNAVRFDHDGVVVLINEDQPWLSTAWYE